MPPLAADLLSVEEAAATAGVGALAGATAFGGKVFDVSLLCGGTAADGVACFVSHPALTTTTASNAAKSKEYFMWFPHID